MSILQVCLNSVDISMWFIFELQGTHILRPLIPWLSPHVVSQGLLSEVNLMLKFLYILFPGLIL